MSKTDSTLAQKTDEKPALTILAKDVEITYRVTLDNDSKDARFRMRKERTDVHAVKGVSLLAHEGEFIGLVGRNGSGKSTLLRALAGLETPTSGSVWASSKPQLLGVNAALIPNLSGLENIRLGLLAMGKTPEEAEERKQYIMNLAKIGDAIRMPMRTYSSGMNARLRFAISVAASPDILMIDEALSTGDAAFVKRSHHAMLRMISGAGTGFLVSHSDSTIERMCTRVIWMDSGEIIREGETKEIMAAYKHYMQTMASESDEAAFEVRDGYRQTFEERIERMRVSAVPSGINFK